MKNNKSLRFVNFSHLVQSVKTSDGGDGGVIFFGKDTSDAFVRQNVTEASEKIELGPDQFFAKEGLLSTPDGARDALKTAQKILSEYDTKNPIYHYTIDGIVLDIKKNSKKKAVAYGKLTLCEIGMPIDTNLICIPQDPTSVNSFRKISVFKNSLNSF